MQIKEADKEVLEDNERLCWHYNSEKPGPVLVLLVGIHGNEPAGVEAVKRIAKKSANFEGRFYGSVYAIAGNLKALEQGVRYIDTDLNRLWELFNTSRDYSLKNGAVKPVEYLESLEIKRVIEAIINRHADQLDDFVFADLHTTSSQSCAFILLNDTLSNRELARKFPVPQILGIEENIQGTLLSYINNLGFRALGFEAGAHDDEISIERSVAFLHLLLHQAGNIELTDVERRKYSDIIEVYEDVPNTYYEVIHHKLVDNAEDFQMIEGFENFIPIEKNTPLAYEHGILIRAPKSGRIFMPLYQKKGHDGFLIVKEVSPFWLEVSGYLRRSSVHGFLRFLPGVTRTGNRSFEVDLNVARFLVKDIFHLLGYRVTEKNEFTLICYRR
ncbi:MAG: succinylglutamate desuccinylase/aspartoacylase family protein [Balneolaceae bacterium]|nr:succinylglutamate desuccinylase/aspartoacylase family protein [Balneolaceae bacterium]